MKTLSPMQQEAAAIAAFIFADLRLDSGPITFERVWNLCTQNGHRVFVRPELPRESAGCYTYLPESSDRGLIFLSSDLTLGESVNVLLHEMTHRLQYSPRYEEFNDCAHQSFDKIAFQEALARAMERLLYERGIPGLWGQPRY